MQFDSSSFWLVKLIGDWDKNMFVLETVHKSYRAILCYIFLSCSLCQFAITEGTYWKEKEALNRSWFVCLLSFIHSFFLSLSFFLSFFLSFGWDTQWSQGCDSPPLGIQVVVNPARLETKIFMHTTWWIQFLLVFLFRSIGRQTHTLDLLKEAVRFGETKIQNQNCKTFLANLQSWLCKMGFGYASFQFLLFWQSVCHFQEN